MGRCPPAAPPVFKQLGHPPNCPTAGSARLSAEVADVKQVAVSPPGCPHHGIEGTMLTSAPACAGSAGAPPRQAARKEPAAPAVALRPKAGAQALDSFLVELDGLLDQLAGAQAELDAL